MSLNEPLLVQKLNANMSYLSERQAMLSRNVANIDTPNFKASDLKKPDFSELVSGNTRTVRMATTSPKHITPPSDATNFDVNSRVKTLQKKPGGNNIVLEEQMGNISDVGMQHQMTSTLLKKFHQLYRMAVETRGS